MCKALIPELHLSNPPRLKDHPAKLQHGHGSQPAIFIAIEAQASGKLKSSADWPVDGEQLKPHKNRRASYTSYESRIKSSAMLLSSRAHAGHHASGFAVSSRS